MIGKYVKAKVIEVKEYDLILKIIKIMAWYLKFNKILFFELASMFLSNSTWKSSVGASFKLLENGLSVSFF